MDKHRTTGNHQFGYAGMVRVFHGYLQGVEPVFLNQPQDFGRLIVGHEKLCFVVGQHGEQPLMVDFAVSVKPLAGPLAAGGIRRVNEYDRFASATVQ